MRSETIESDARMRFEEALSAVQRVISDLCRRKGLGREEAEDFESWVMLKLIENDYARFRKFRGESTLHTYLTTVVARLLLDYRRVKWGKWRPSAKAKRLGEVATTLEALVYRDGMSFREASQTLLSTSSSFEEETIDALLARIPVRHRPVHVSADLVELTDGTPATRLVDERDARYTAATIRRGLTEAFQSMSEQDRLILRLRFVGGLTVREIAEVLQVRARWLYRHLSSLLDSMRFVLMGAGVDVAAVYSTPNALALDLERVITNGGSISTMAASARGLVHTQSLMAGAHG